MPGETIIERDERGRVSVVYVLGTDERADYVREPGGLFRAFICRLRPDGSKDYTIKELNVDELPDAVRHNFLH
jgi:hypothetical protein